MVKETRDELAEGRVGGGGGGRPSMTLLVAQVPRTTLWY